MATNHIYNAAKDAIIYLKDGQRKHGILVGDNREQMDTFHFISNFNLFTTPVNRDFLEVIPKILIESIDTDLK